MDIASWLGLSLLLALGWLWMSSLRVLEIARNAGRQACLRADVQFLDDTVASTSLTITRDDFGRRKFRRTYYFEFTETGNTRIAGHVIMLRDKVESITMEPYQILP